MIMFTAVHEANMAKKRGMKDRLIQHELDAVKPDKWKDPKATIKVLLKQLKAREA
jgi:predicted HAD superfamily Cof-like phosphohydrolase